MARGEQGINGCVSSSKFLVPPPIDDDDDIDGDSTEERYEFDIPKPIIEKGELEPRGAYSAFVGKFIGVSLSRSIARKALLTAVP